MNSLLIRFNDVTRQAFTRNTEKLTSIQKSEFLTDYGKSLLGFRNSVVPKDTLARYLNSGKEIIIFECWYSDFCRDYFIKIFTSEGSDYIGQGYSKECAEKLKPGKQYKISAEKMKKLLDSRGQINNWQEEDCFYVMTRFKDGDFDTDLLFQCTKVYND